MEPAWGASWLIASLRCFVMDRGINCVEINWRRVHAGGGGVRILIGNGKDGGRGGNKPISTVLSKAKGICLGGKVGREER